ncbi:MAG: GNAT family protein, partial [Phycisphaerales bacterium]
VEVLPRPDLTTERLTFRMLTASDAPAFIAALDRSRALLRRWIPINRESESDAHFFHRTMTRARIQNTEGNAWRRAAFLDSGDQRGRFVGMFNLIKIERGLEWSCEANWWVDADLSGRGLATEGVRGILDFALAEHPVGLGLHRVRAMICKDNPASVRIAQKCGLSPTGGRDLFEINNALVNHDEYECWAGGF